MFFFSSTSSISANITHKSFIQRVKKLELNICNTVLTKVCDRPEKQIFPLHLLGTTLDYNHVYRLVNTITKCHVKVRLHYLCKT